MKKVTPAKAYGNLITRKGNIVSVINIRLFDGHQYNWHQGLVNNGVIHTPTDQTYDLEANYSSEPHWYDEVWFEGVCIYKKPLFYRIRHFITGK